MLHLIKRTMVLMAPLALTSMAFAGTYVTAGTYKVDANNDANDGSLTSTGASGELDFDGVTGGDSDWVWNANKGVYEEVDLDDEGRKTGKTVEFTATEPEGTYTWVMVNPNGADDTGTITKYTIDPD